MTDRGEKLYKWAPICGESRSIGCAFTRTRLAKTNGEYGAHSMTDGSQSGDVISDGKGAEPRTERHENE